MLSCTVMMRLSRSRTSDRLHSKQQMFSQASAIKTTGKMCLVCTVSKTYFWSLAFQSSQTSLACRHIHLIDGNQPAHVDFVNAVVGFWLRLHHVGQHSRKSLSIVIDSCRGPRLTLWTPADLSIRSRPSLGSGFVHTMSHSTAESPASRTCSVLLVAQRPTSACRFRRRRRRGRGPSTPRRTARWRR